MKKVLLSLVALLVLNACSGGSGGGGDGGSGASGSSNVTFYSASEYTVKLSSFTHEDLSTVDENSFDFDSGVSPTGGKLDSTAFWVGTSAGTVLRVGLDGTLEETIGGVDSPLYFDTNSTDVWVADDGNGVNALDPRVYRISKDSNSVEDEFIVADVSESYDGLFLTDDHAYVLISNGFQLARINLTSGAIETLNIAGDTDDIGSLTDGVYGYGSMAKIGDTVAIVYDDYFKKILKINLDTFTVTDVAYIDTITGENNWEIKGSNSAGLFIFSYADNKIHLLNQDDFSIVDTFEPTEDIDEWLVSDEYLSVAFSSGSITILDKSFSTIALGDGIYPEVQGFEIE